MQNHKRDNYAKLFQFDWDDYFDEKEIIQVLCPYCYKSSSFDLLKFENRCKHCSIIINQEAIEYVQSEN